MVPWILTVQGSIPALPQADHRRPNMMDQYKKTHCSQEGQPIEAAVTFPPQGRPLCFVTSIP